MKVYKLENIFTGDIVFCENIEEVKPIDNLKFITVFKEENTNRTFLVNKDAFKVISYK